VTPDLFTKARCNVIFSIFFTEERVQHSLRTCPNRPSDEQEQNIFSQSSILQRRKREKTQCPPMD
jgi:hypothetical protein